MREYLSENRQRMNTAGELATQAGAVNGAARDTLDHGLVYGSPETVCQKLEPLREIGVGGVIIHFRLGAMPWEDAAHSLQLFAEKVAPELGGRQWPQNLTATD
jgi:alkanesulfonate monooxygenase SsuD/methylene tetrahydromethanopterin reductase-like flavin-dependent oxidoreductase (luciferase family)